MLPRTEHVQSITAFGNSPCSLGIEVSKRISALPLSALAGMAPDLLWQQDGTT